MLTNKTLCNIELDEISRENTCMKIRMLFQNRFNLILAIIHSKLGIKSKNQLIFRIPAGLWSCPVFVFLSLSFSTRVIFFNYHYTAIICSLSVVISYKVGFKLIYLSKVHTVNTDYIFWQLHTIDCRWSAYFNPQKCTLIVFSILY